ncbi:MAG TPA: thymidine phosphorylase [Anaerolineales bacterium]|nr:thymidine phosphorylase [Anaerolineales bacterium]
MRAVDIIVKKRDHQELTRQEIEFFVQGYTRGEIPDYQASAWAMAVLLNGMTPRETTDLTLAMAHSGEVLDLSGVVPIAVDKHSTGGVGDKTTLVIAPAIAACGLPVGKMSGRGLGFSGGTLDKLESIPGYRCNLSTAEFIEQLRTVGIVVTGQSADLAPADGKLYALRDVTGTVQALPLIASSVMSKKIAAGAQAILLDVKVGQGAFMKTLEDGRRLAELMVEIGRLAGRRVAALLSDMNQPLGRAVGNALELREALDTLRGKGPEDFREHCLVAAGHLLVLGGKAADEKQGYALVQKAIADDRAFDLFRTMVKAQGGDVRYLDEPDKLAHASLVEVVPAPRSGYLSGINAQVVGETAVLLGGGRAQKGDAIDYGVGLEILRKVGERVENGEPLFIVHANDAAKAAEARKLVLAAHTWSNEPVEPLPLFYGLIQ